LVSWPAFFATFFVFDPAFLISLVWARTVDVVTAPAVASARNTNNPYVAGFIEHPSSSRIDTTADRNRVQGSGLRIKDSSAAA
jgi:hypothetical protein